MEIIQLESETVDKIAAGEVVERPAHLLKELLENSLDAGATDILIEVDQGGREILVRDNGKGVLLEDLPKVFDRHATSKIKDSDDLWNLHSFGFRGEALASISSVSDLRFVSRRKGEDQAYVVECQFGQMGQVTESSSPEGTSVQVRNLFENIPARLKFLKSDSAEVTQIKNVVKALGLQYHQVSWKLKVKGKLLYVWEAQETALERAKKVLETDRLYENEYEYEGFKARVIFSDPSTVVKVSRQIWTFVQNRWVQDRGLQAAVMEAYRSLLMHGQYPICVVSIDCPTDQVDVNIHPTKSQVKFVNQKTAFRVVHYCLREALEKAPWRPQQKTSVPLEKEKARESLSFESLSREPTNFKQKKNFVDFSKPGGSPSVGLQELKVAAQREDFVAAAAAPSLASEVAPSMSEEGLSSQGFWSSLQVIGQVDLTYIVAQSSDKMILVDQHAAHERVAFEKLMKAWKDGNVEVQSLLLPLTLDFSEPEVEALLECREDLQKIGIQIEREGPASLALSSLPAFIRERGLVEAMKVMARESLDKGGSFAIEKSIGDLFATMACHSVIRAGQSLSLDEMKQLLKDMDEFPLSDFCPHGRSVSLEFPFVKLEKDFGRRV